MERYVWTNVCWCKPIRIRNKPIHPIPPTALGYCYFFASISSICFLFVRYGILFCGFRVRWWGESLFSWPEGGFSFLDRGADKGGGILIFGQSRYWSACFKAIVRGDWWSLKVTVANAHSLENIQDRDSILWSKGNLISRGRKKRMIGNNALNAQSRLQPNRQNGKLHYHLINLIGSTPLNAQMA